MLSKLTRLQIVLLSIATCSIVFAVTLKTTGNPVDNGLTIADNISKQSGNTPTASKTSKDRTSIALNLSDASRSSKTDQTPQKEKKIHPLPDDEKARSATLALITPTKKVIEVATNAEIVSRQETPQTKKTITRTIKSGDNLSNLFSKVGLSAREVHAITTSSKEGKALTQMYPGEKLEFIFSSDKKLEKVIRQKSALEAVHFIAANDDFDVEHIVLKPKIKQIHQSGTVKQSLSLAASKSGISQKMTMNMANIFGGVIDFVYDVRSGDTFTLIFEEQFLNNEKIGEGNIIAAQYVNRGKAHNAFRYVHNNGEIGYYNEDGISMRKAFLRAPLDFTRVSSGFNLRRLHPITKKVKPHRGIDYAAATGTPVFSVGEGRVAASGYSKANGKYVFIKHGESYTTKYLHLSKRTVKRGQRVKQGQIIGKVGCTGLCTGPHLHYEFLVNGVHRNPRTIVKKLPKAKRLAKAELPTFTQATLGSQDILRRHSSQFELASNE